MPRWELQIMIVIASVALRRININASAFPPRKRDLNHRLLHLNQSCLTTHLVPLSLSFDSLARSLAGVASRFREQWFKWKFIMLANVVTLQKHRSRQPTSTIYRPLLCVCVCGVWTITFENYLFKLHKIDLWLNILCAAFMESRNTRHGYFLIA